MFIGRQFRDQYALPQVPKYLGKVVLKGKVVLEAGIKLHVGEAGGKAHQLSEWGTSGSIQHNPMEQSVGAFSYVEERKETEG